MLIKLSKREKILIALVLISSIFYIYFKFFIVNTLDSIILSRSNINKYKTEINSIKTTEIQNKNLRKELGNLKNEVNISIKTLPENERNPEIAFNLKYLGDKSNIGISSISFGQSSELMADNKSASNAKNSTARQGIFIVPVNMSITGEYSGIMEFINLIENDIRIAEVSNLSMSSSGLTSNMIQANINISYYYINGVTDIEYDFNNGVYGKNDLFK